MLLVNISTATIWVLSLSRSSRGMACRSDLTAIRTPPPVLPPSPHYHYPISPPYLVERLKNMEVVRCLTPCRLAMFRKYKPDHRIPVYTRSCNLDVTNALLRIAVLTYMRTSLEARPDDSVIVCNPALCFMLIVIGYVNVCKVQSFYSGKEV